jgi:hypothetical protein
VRQRPALGHDARGALYLYALSQPALRITPGSTLILNGLHACARWGGVALHELVPPARTASPSTRHDALSDDRDGDTDGVVEAADNCPTSRTRPSDTDGDGVGDACDGCVLVANPRVSRCEARRSPWLTTTGGQRDDDHDGYGNKCDAKFPGNAGEVVGAADLVELRASNGKGRELDECGAGGVRPCAIFDLDETDAVVGAGDLTLFRARNGKAPGPRCASCPLACEAGASGSCVP